MARKAIRSAPETSRLVLEAPPELVTTFLRQDNFTTLVEDVSAFDLLPTGDDNERIKPVLDTLRDLPIDRIRHIEVEARRITALSDSVEETLLRKMAETALLGRANDFALQRDALARSLWCYCEADGLFANVERAVHTRHYRDHGKLYDAYEVEADAPATSEEIDKVRLAEQIVARFQHDEGCEVEAVDLPVEDGSPPSVMIVATSAGPFSSQRSVEKKAVRTIYYRPPEEVILVYTPADHLVEACAPDAAVRHSVTAAFAEAILGQDISKKPLARKIYDFGRFRSSLTLPIPPEWKDVVYKASLTEIQITLNSWKQRLSLKVTGDDDIESYARRAFGNLNRLSQASAIARVEFHVRYRARETGKERSFSFTVSGRNRCSIQNNRDPEKRKLGFGLLEAWGIMTRFRDLTASEEADLLPVFLKLFDYPEPDVSGSLLVDYGVDVERLETGACISRTSLERTVLLEDELFGDHEALVLPTGSGDAAVLEPAEGVDGERVTASDLARFKVELPLVREKIERMLHPLNRTGKTFRISDHLFHLGTVKLGDRSVPAWLARCLLDDPVLENVDRAIRGETDYTQGIVFVATGKPISFLGSHVVVSIAECIHEDGACVVDPATVETRYLAARAMASSADTVTFLKSGKCAAVLTIPGKPPWPIVGEMRVQIVETLYAASRTGNPLVRTGDLMAKTSSSHPRQVFRSDWSDIKDVYLTSPKHGFWQVCA